MGLNSVGVVKDTTEVEILHPKTGEPLLTAKGDKMVVEIYGPHSSHYKVISHAQQNKRLMKAQRTGGRLNLSAEEIEASAFDLLVKCVAGWNIELDEGEPAKFSEEAVREVFTKHPWVRSQVEAVFGDERAFLD